MDPVNFPPQIQKYFLDHYNENADEDDLIRIFKESNTVKEEFIAWAAQHPSTVDAIPRIYNALNIAKSPDTIDLQDVEWHGAARSVNNIFKYFTQLWNGKGVRKNELFSMLNNPDKFFKQADMYNHCTAHPDQYVNEVFDLFHAGLIDDQQKKNALLIKHPTNDVYALANKGVWDNAFPILEHELKRDELADFLSTKNLNNKSIVDFFIKDVIEGNNIDHLTFLNIINLLSSNNKIHSNPDTNKAVKTSFIDCVTELNYQQVMKFLSMKLHKGITILPDLSTYFVSIFRNLDPKDYLKLLSITADDGSGPLNNKNACENSITIFKKMAAQKKIDSKFIVSFLSIHLQNLGTLLHTQFFQDIIPLLNYLDENELITVLSLKNSEGVTPLHYPSTLIKSFNLIKNLSVNGLHNLMITQNNEGNTPIHNKLLTKEFRAILAKLNPSIFEIRNEAGFTPIEWQQISVSPNWIVKDKKVLDSKLLTEKEFNEKAKVLRNTLNTLWNSFVFGDAVGDIPKHYLSIKITDIDKTYTKEFSPDEIGNALNVILDKITKKTAWLGTPKKEDADGLHKFYSQMLNNLEEIVLQLDKMDPKEKAGQLLAIATPELEGRCAAAYQSEIEQVKMVMDFDNGIIGLDANFDKMIRASLLGAIENIVRKKYKGDSHVFTQMLYSVGLAPNPDPLFMADAHYIKLDVRKCQELIIDAWGKNTLISDLTESMDRIPNDELQDWFQSQTPKNYGKDKNYGDKLAKVKRGEEVVALETKNALVRSGIKKPDVEKILDIFKSTNKGMQLQLGSVVRKHVSERVFDKAFSAMTPEDITEAQDLYKLDNQIKNSRKMQLLDLEDALKEKPRESLTEEEKADLAIYTTERQRLQRESLGIATEFNVLKGYGEARVKLRELIEAEHLSVTKEDFAFIVEAKKTFDGKINSLAERLQIAFTPSQTGLPSKSMEYLRKSDFTSQFFSEKDYRIKMNRKGAYYIAHRLRVLQNTT